MSSTLTDERRVVFATDTERHQAQRLRRDGSLDAHLLPAELHHLLDQVLQAIADGGTVTVGSMPEELTTTVAARELGISRPTLMKMIREGHLPAHRVGSHHRVKAADILKIKQDRLDKRQKAFEDLQAVSDELDL